MPIVAYPHFCVYVVFYFFIFLFFIFYFFTVVLDIVLQPITIITNGKILLKYVISNVDENKSQLLKLYIKCRNVIPTNATSIIAT